MKWRADARRLTSPAGDLLIDLKEDDLWARVVQTGFINHQLLRHCAEAGVTFTRSRPYRNGLKDKQPKVKEVRNPLDHPFRRTFSWKEASRTSSVRQPGISSRTS